MHITDIKGTVDLNNGVKMPYFGLGVFETAEGEEVINAVTWALDCGYKHIDTATLYRNEKGVGEAIANHRIPREEVFVTTKVWNSDQGYDKTIQAFERSLNLLGFDYIDLYLIHWPLQGKYIDTWRALEYLYKQKIVKAIGISNFTKKHMEHLIQNSEIVPMVNQMEFHPYLVQQDLIDYCNDHNIQYQAWSPLMRGGILKIDLINSLAEKYNKTPVQIVLRWNLQKGVVTIPKSSRKDRIIDNANIFDFELSDKDVELIDNLDRNLRIGPDPDNFDF